MPDTFATRDSRGEHATKLGVVVILLSLLTVVSAAVTGVQAKRQADCQSAYNAAFAYAFQARARANDGDRAALNTMIVGIADPKATPSQRQTYIFRYVEQIKASDAERKAHPLPNPPDPRTLCGS